MDLIMDLIDSYDVQSCPPQRKNSRVAQMTAYYENKSEEATSVLTSANKSLSFESIRSDLNFPLGNEPVTHSRVATFSSLVSPTSKGRSNPTMKSKWRSFEDLDSVESVTDNVESEISKSSTLPTVNVIRRMKNESSDKDRYKQDSSLRRGVPVKPLRSPKIVYSLRTYSECRHLIMAAKEGNIDMAKWLLEHGVNPNLKDSKGRTALLTAACFNRLDVFKCLLKSSNVNQVDDNGWNSLHIGAVTGHLKIVQESLKFIHVDSRSRSGLTALCLAVNRGHLEIVEHLLQQGADSMISSYQGWTPLHFAARGGFHLCLYVLLESGNCQRLLDAKTSDDVTPLALAVQSGNFDSVRFLLDSGAYPNPRDSRGWTPARMAAILNYKDISKYLASYKATM